MQVIKTKKGIYYREKIYLDGKAIHSPRFLRKSDAITWKARFLSERYRYQATGVLPEVFQADAQDVTFGDYANLWLEARVRPQLSKRTYEHYQAVLERHLLPRFGKLYLKEIRLGLSDNLIKELYQRGHNARGINLILGIFKRVLIEAVKENRLEKNPFQYLRELKEQARPDVYMTSEEIEKVLAISKGHYFNSLFIIALNTGMRRGEIAGLCWDRVNFDRNMIEISRMRDRDGLSDRTKTNGSRRFIPMNAVVRNHLLELKQTSKHKLVVVDEHNSPFDTDHLSREFHRFLKIAEIEARYRFHDLRHTFASHFMMNGGNIYDLQKILGHSSLEMTQRYAHLAPEHLASAANVVSFGAKMVAKNLSLKVAAPI
jgi:integrase